MCMQILLHPVLVCLYTYFVPGSGVEPAVGLSCETFVNTVYLHFEYITKNIYWKDQLAQNYIYWKDQLAQN